MTVLLWVLLVTYLWFGAAIIYQGDKYREEFPVWVQVTGALLWPLFLLTFFIKRLVNGP